MATRLPSAIQPVRAIVWVGHLALPLLGLWLLLARPDTDMVWHNAMSHFWLVVVVAAVNVAMGTVMSAAAHRRSDARLFLVSLVFLTSAGFLLLHALATPGVLLGHPNAGFDVATPLGLALASIFAAASSISLGSRGAAVVLRGRYVLWGLVAALLLGWGAVSLLDLPPLNQPAQPREVDGPLAFVAAASVALYIGAAARYFLIHRKAPAAVLISVITAFTLLAEAMVAVTMASKWHLSWWEWHLLLTFAFGFVAYSAYVQYGREGSSAGLFDAITLSATARLIQAEYESALEDLVTALGERERRDGGPSIAAAVANRFGMTEGQAAVLDRAGAALSAERDTSRRLAALAAVGERARVGLDDEAFTHEALTLIRPAYGDVTIGLVSDGTLAVDGRTYDVSKLGWSPEHGRNTEYVWHPVYVHDGLISYPLTVKGGVAGVLEVRSDVSVDPALLTALANQLSISLENARLYRELGTLFRRYMSPDVAAALLADPDQSALGGSVVEVTALFADLRGFTAFSEGVEPAEIVRMLNRYHGVAVPAILDNGGTIVQFVGDALLALFNAPARQADHAVRAVRAAFALQAGVEVIAAREPTWPRFRVGANTGPALVGNIGSEALRGFNAMGDAVNIAARLQTLAEPGQIVIGETTMRAVGDAVVARPLGELEIKGRTQPVRAFNVTGLAEPL